MSCSRLGIYARLSLAAFSLTVMATATSAAAQDSGDTCKRFTLTSTGENRAVAFHDAGEPGVSIGDVRVGARQLIDETGEPAGTYRWYITPIDPLAPPGSSPVSLYRGYFLLPDGMIMTEGVYEPASAVEKTTSVSVTDGERAVVAGTGAYRTLRGYMIEKVLVRHEEEGKPLGKTFAFVLNCPDG